jgi:molybdenum cofactor cytidylyltransferase
MSRHIAAVVLAAGASTRLGQPKQLIRFHGEQLIDRALRIAHEAGAASIFVVLGSEYERILAAITPNHFGARILINKGWHHGMSTSVALGVAAAERVGAQDVIVLTCDQVTVTPEHLRGLVVTSKRERVVASLYHGRAGIPAIFPEFSFHALQDLAGDQGAREVLQNDSVLTVALPGGEFDIDTPADLERLRRIESDGLTALDPLDEEDAA